MNSDTVRRAIEAIDAAHAVDEKRVDGRPAEIVYVERVGRWVETLVGDPSAALLLAARAQHLERWAIPRTDYPTGRGGYFRWRKAVQRRQGERAAEILSAVGCDDALGRRVATLVAKAAAADDAEGQALEDAACLVFLESELATFAHDHRDYTEEKFVDIVRKTWKRMSPAGRAQARTIPLAPELARLVDRATTDVVPPTVRG